MTAEAREFLAKYEAYRDACTESGKQLYEEFFCRRKSVFFSSGTQTSSFTCLQNSNDVRIACIIMASGLGKRFGSNKLMASFHGAPLIHSVLDVTGSVPLFADRLVVTRSREVHDYCQSLGIPVLIHTLPNRNEALCLGVKKAPGFIRLSLCTRRSAASASTDTGTDMPALSRMQNITRSLKICFPRF